MSDDLGSRLSLWLTVAVVLVVPLVLFQIPVLEWVLKVEGLSPARLAAQLEAASPPRLLDVGTAPLGAGGHIHGASAVSVAGLEARLGQLGLDPERALVVVCAHGRSSLLVAGMLRAHGFRSVAHLRGGMTAWRASGLPAAAGEAPSLRIADPAAALPQVGLVAQLASVVSGLGFKPAYMVLCLALILFLWRARDRDLGLIRNGLLAFLLAESFCAANYLCCGGGSVAFDTLHGLGMVVMGVLVPWGLLVLVDERVLGLTGAQRACSFKKLCGGCGKYEELPCLAQRMMLVVTPALAALSLMPWSAPLVAKYQVHEVFSTPVLFAYALELQLLDFRLYPTIACVCFLLALLLLRGGAASLARAQLPFFVGLGCLLFSLFRFFLLEAYRAVPQWSDFWEEATELCIILILGLFFYWYRHRLGLPALTKKDP